jgi:hypothetical protein
MASKPSPFRLSRLFCPKRLKVNVVLEKAQEDIIVCPNLIDFFLLHPLPGIVPTVVIQQK